MKIYNMKEWTLYREASNIDCIKKTCKCIPSYKDKDCVDCYSDYVERNLISRSNPIYLKGDCDAKDS